MIELRSRIIKTQDSRLIKSPLLCFIKKHTFNLILAAGGCSDYVGFAGNCYKLINQMTNYADAVTYCQNDGAILVELFSQLKQDFVEVNTVNNLLLPD